MTLKEWKSLKMGDFVYSNKKKPTAREVLDVSETHCITLEAISSLSKHETTVYCKNDRAGFGLDISTEYYFPQVYTRTSLKDKKTDVVLVYCSTTKIIRILVYSKWNKSPGNKDYIYQITEEDAVFNYKATRKILPYGESVWISASKLKKNRMRPRF